PGTEDVDVKNFPLVAPNRRDHRRAMVDLPASSNSGGDGSRIAQIAIETLEIQAVKSGVIASLPDQRPDRMALIQQAADEVCSEMAASSGDQRSHAGLEV